MNRRAQQAKANSDAIINIQESAVKNAPIDFFRMNSEVKSTGSIVLEAQTNLIAQTSLGYYFERLANNPSYGEMQAFRQRAQSVKDSIQDTLERVKTEKLQFTESNSCTSNKRDLIIKLEKLSDLTDGLIIALGRLVNNNPTKTLAGTHNALVASYEIFGNISHASEIVQLSGGVSGSSMSQVVYKEGV